MQVSRTLALTLFSAVSCSAATFGTVVARAQSLTDLVVDEVHRRVYVSYFTTSQGQVDVYSTVGLTAASKPAFTIRTGATPLSMAISRDGNSLYVACYDASSLDVFDLRTTTFSKTTSVAL